MSEYEFVERPVLILLCGESGVAYGARGIGGGLGWIYRGEAAMAAYDRSLDDPLVEKILIEKLKLINSNVKTDVQARLAVAALRKTMSHPDKLTANRQTLDLLRDGARVPLAPGENATTVRFIAVGSLITG